MDNYPRVPSRVIGLNDTSNCNRHNGEVAPPTNLYQQQPLMLQPPPLLIHTASYVSNRSASNRSVSNRSLATSASRGRYPQNPATQGAELIAIATTQARAAAQSILLAGGSQAAALSTANAAAKSVLLPAKEDGAGKPPIGSTRNGNFRNRRKNRQQAEIIASMALVSANETLEYGSMGHDMVTMTPGGLRSVYHDDRESEFPDDYTNYRSLGQGSLYGRSHSVRSYKEMQQLRFPEYREQSRQDKQIMMPFNAVEHEIKLLGPITGTVQDISLADQTTLDSKVLDNGDILKADKSQSINNMIPAKTPSAKGIFQGIQIPGMVNDSETLGNAPPRTKIPTEMPMPRSNSMKAFAPLKGHSSGKQQVTLDRNGTPRSRQQQSESQISCYSDHSSVSHTNSYSYAGSTYDEHTADYTRGTFESVVDSTTRRKSSHINRSSGASFFSTMDPFVRTFSEVFSCNPVPPVPNVQKSRSQIELNRRLKPRESRDMVSTAQYDSSNIKLEKRDIPPPQAQTMNLSNAAPRRSTSVDDSMLSSNDIPILAERGIDTANKELSNNKKKLTSPTMEQLVLRALSAISPKGAAAKRPRLNVKPMNQSAGPAMTTANPKNGIKYRSVNDGSGNTAVNDAVQKRRAGKDVLKVLSRASVKPKNTDAATNKIAAKDISLDSNSSGNQQPQQHHQHHSSSSSEYYISASSDDSTNLPSVPELPAQDPTMPTTMNHKANDSNINHHHLENKMKRFPSFSFNRSKRVMRGNNVE